MAEIKNIKKTAQRILKAVKNKEKIILYGDADLDGIGSVIILKEAIKNLGGRVETIYFLDRETEGYGLNEVALAYLGKYSPALLILLDCGIGNFEEVKSARKMGFEVVIVDHHEPLKKLPQASLIVNPKQKGDRYPFKKFATVGIVFRLAETLLKKKLSLALKNNFLELVALATISDMMPQKEDNLEFIEGGLTSLRKTVRPALKVFWQMDLIAEKNIGRLVQRIISVCHAGDSKNHFNEGYLLLNSISVEEAEVLVKKLLEKAEVKQARIKEIAEEVKQKIVKDETIIFEGGSAWPVLMLGPVASKICHLHKKPVFLYSKKNNYCQGAVRTPQGIDGVQAMLYCSKGLETYGGHPQAAGFRVKEKDLEQFKKCLIKYFKNI